ncbi:MAG: energy transducer TonB, partial [Bacteroidota bacterium]
LVSFTVDENGEVKDPFVIRDIGEGCGEEAIRVIQNMPVWEPAQQVGRAVAVKLKLRVQFSLNDAEEDFSDVYKISWGLLRGQSVSRDALVNNTRYPLSVRDQYGNELSVSELTFIYSKNDRVREVSSKGHVSADQIDLIKKIKKGGDLTITAVVQKEGSFINVGRVFEILN